MGKGKKSKESAGNMNTKVVGGLSNQQNSLAAKTAAAVTDVLRPGRYKCDCQARIHALVLNCMGCGRIVCAQEGSGPCFTCGALVCTREEREVLNKGNKRSVELLAKLTAATSLPSSSQKQTFAEMSSISKALEDATAFRNKLLEADADTERRTRVNDLQSDYSKEESNAFLTAEERESLVRRREELRELRKQERRNYVLDIDIDNEIVSQDGILYLEDNFQHQSNKANSDGDDFLILKIIERADERRRASEAAHNAAKNPHWSPMGFMPKYDEDRSRRVENKLNDEEKLIAMSATLGVLEVEAAGYAIAVPQPLASLIVKGMIRELRWPSDLMLQGPIFVCSTVDPITEAEITKCIADFCKNPGDVKKIDFATGAVLGRVYLEDCFTVDEFRNMFGVKSTIAGSGDHVLSFSSVEPYVMPVPHIPPSTFYQLDKNLKSALMKS